jgi:hypothetical protein
MRRALEPAEYYRIEGIVKFIRRGMDEGGRGDDILHTLLRYFSKAPISSNYDGQGSLVDGQAGDLQYMLGHRGGTRDVGGEKKRGGDD